jgi:hypothetical protein
MQSRWTFRINANSSRKTLDQDQTVSQVIWSLKCNIYLKYAIKTLSNKKTLQDPHTSYLLLLKLCKCKWLWKYFCTVHFKNVQTFYKNYWNQPLLSCLVWLFGNLDFAISWGRAALLPNTCSTHTDKFQIGEKASQPIWSVSPFFYQIFQFKLIIYLFIFINNYCPLTIIKSAI